VKSKLETYLKKRAAKAVLFYALLFLLFGCQQEQQYQTISGYTMGTTYHITLESHIELADEIHQKVEKRLQIINQLMSTYIDESELSMFNKTESTECLPVSKETYDVVKSSVVISNETFGKFDVTIAPLISEWGFDKKQTNDQVPSEKKIESLLKQVGYNKLKLGTNCITKEIANLSINLSAIAKGYGVDQVALLIELNGITNYLVEIGGETASRGINGKGKIWRLAIEAPVEQHRKIQAVFSPKGLGVATSGDYRNYFEKDGVRFSHTLDPTTGKPITHSLVSVTVLHEKTTFADAYATAFMVMGKESTLEFARKYQLAVYLLVKTDSGFEEFYSDQFSQYLANKE